MKCPRCDVLLNEITKASVLVDACPRCLGIWLDRGELEKIGARLREVERDWAEPPSGARGAGTPPGWRRDDDDDDDGRRAWGRGDDDNRHHRKKRWSDIFEIFD